MTSINEWGDPYPIVEDDRSTDEEDDRRAEIAAAIADEYEETHTTTPLDAGCSFVLQELARATDDAADAYRFRAKRFLGIRPAGTYTGEVRADGDEWVVSFDEPDGLLSRVRPVFGRVRYSFGRILPW